jgi:hypothetical protein|eukprot:31379-Pelagococcus_subviridis.AAC.7
MNRVLARRAVRHSRARAVMADKPFKILYCTGNHGKFAEAKCVIDEYNTLGADVDKLRWVEIQRVDADPVEVQGSQVEIATRKVKEAVKIFHETGRGREVLEGARASPPSRPRWSPLASARVVSTVPFARRRRSNHVSPCLLSLADRRDTPPVPSSVPPSQARTSSSPRTSASRCSA